MFENWILKPPTPQWNKQRTTLDLHERQKESSLISKEINLLKISESLLAFRQLLENGQLAALEGKTWCSNNMDALETIWKDASFGFTGLRAGFSAKLLFGDPLPESTRRTDLDNMVRPLIIRSFATDGGTLRWGCGSF